MGILQVEVDSFTRRESDDEVVRLLSRFEGDLPNEYGTWLREYDRRVSEARVKQRNNQDAQMMAYTQEMRDMTVEMRDLAKRSTSASVSALRVSYISLVVALISFVLSLVLHR